MNFLSSLNKKNLQNKTCLLRIDLNIKNIAEGANLKNRSGFAFARKNIHPRILAILPTIKFLIDKGVKIVILSHYGRPNKSNFKSQKYSLKPFAKILSFLLKESVRFIDFKKGFNMFKIRKIITVANDNIFLLENLRFFPDEEKNNKKFAEQLSSLGDFYINDAFGVSHRKNASIHAIVEFLPSFAGFAMEKEIKNLNQIIKNSKKPLVVILGGAKIFDKIGMIKKFFKKADYFLIGGGIANTFMAAQDLPIGDSLCEKEMISMARQLLKFKKIFLPIDVLVDKRKILDIGPRTIEKYSKIIQNAKTIIWNGPMGYIENEEFRKGSEEIAKLIIKSRAFSVIGGGETVISMSRIKNFSFVFFREVQSSQTKSVITKQKSNVFISSGGGAMLKYLAGNKLPGLTALNSNNKKSLQQFANFAKSINN